MGDIQELHRKINLSLGAIVFGVAFIISTTFYATSVYYELMKRDENLTKVSNELHLEIQTLGERIEYVNDRIDRKIESVEEKFK